MPDPRANHKTGIYRITNKVNGKFYIGSAVNLRMRFYEHIRLLNKKQHPNEYLQKAWIKYGAENFGFEVIEYCLKEELIEREQFFMDLYQVVDFGYNINPLAGLTRLDAKLNDEQRKNHAERMIKLNKGRKLSEETKEKMRQSHKGLKHKPMSDEGKLNISLSHMGIKRNFSEKHCEKLSEAARHREHKPCSMETRVKLSIANKGRKPSPQTIDALILSRKGKKLSPETRERISIAHKGRKMSPDYCTAMSARITDWWKLRHEMQNSTQLH